jgi:hypothetical protein
MIFFFLYPSVISVLSVAKINKNKNKKAMGPLPMAFRMMAEKGSVKASQKRWVNPAF